MPEDAYIKKDLVKTDINGEVERDMDGNPIIETRYYLVEKRVMTEWGPATANATFDFSEKYTIDAVSSLNGIAGSQSKDVTLNFSRTDTYAYRYRMDYVTYSIKDPQGKTLAELDMHEGEMFNKIISDDRAAQIELLGEDYKFDLVYGAEPGTEWTKTATGDKVLKNPNSTTSFYINMPSNAFRVSHTITNSALAGMSDGQTQSSDLTFRASGTATGSLSPATDYLTTSELNFDKIRLNVPKKGLDIQAGTEADHIIHMEWSALNLSIIGLAGTNTLTREASESAINQVKYAMEFLSETRSTFGAYQNRMEHAIRMTDNVVENTTAAESRIRDTDMAKTIMENSKESILQQAGQAMIAQANQSKQGVLELLQ
ncbi:MAG: hypothetical protein K5739_09070 [Lachnospiraceae bacterium]|nr:hypothetical protein [Lachnospiraceae bacterium]